MGFWNGFCKTSAEHFPNRLEDKPVAAHLPRRWVLVAVLLLICLLPRLWAAWHWDIVCTDGVTYLVEAEALERRDFDFAFSGRGLNIYPVILMWLGKTGLDIVQVGQWWSVAMATLAILPLFGWVRRQFDDRVAAAACLLYAFQPILVKYSPLIMRDPTFWFLFNLSIYLMWRAIMEVRLSLFLATGIALTLAIHTRQEGWLLLVPLVLWSVFRLPSIAGSRLRLTIGVVACMAVIPLSVALVNVTWLRECPQWKTFRGGDIQRTTAWLKSFHRPAKEPAVVKAAEEQKSAGRVAQQMAVRIAKSYSYVYGLLMLAGLWGRRRIYFRRDHQTLLVMSLLVFAAVWIRCSKYDICLRYFSPVVIVSLPWIAFGVFWVCDLMVGWTGWFFSWSPSRRCTLVTVLFSAVVVASLLETSPGPTLGSRQKASLGKWILHNFGSNQNILCVNNDARLAYYYAKGTSYTCLVFSQHGSQPLFRTIKARSPKVVLIWSNHRDKNNPNTALEILDYKSELGYSQVPEDRLPPDCKDVVVLIADK